MMTPISLYGGVVLKPDGTFDRADVHIENGRIVDTAVANATVLDCEGKHVLPGIVDVHGDAFELEIHPRPGVEIPIHIALGSIDRQLLSNGITTAFHGLTVSWEPGARSLDAARSFMTGLDRLRASLVADHRVQLRWETFAHDAVEDIAGWLEGEPTPAIAFNDHTSSTLDTVRSGDQQSLEKWARRAGVTLDQYVEQVTAIENRACDIETRVREVADLAASASAIMLSHDDKAGGERRANRALGMAVCEFPLTADAAAEAVAHGEHVVMGAPNVIRGSSHKGYLSAEDAVRDGQCTVLASDYYYPGLFHAAECLVGRGATSMAEAWNLISRNPARAMGLRDRGAIDLGLRADVLVIDCSGPWRLVHTVAEGAAMRFGA